MGVHKSGRCGAVPTLWQRRNSGSGHSERFAANERCALATVDTIVEEMQQTGIGSPAVIVIGEVVREHPAYVREYVASNCV